jgi:hypothetical protein
MMLHDMTSKTGTYWPYAMVASSKVKALMIMAVRKVGVIFKPQI